MPTRSQRHIGQLVVAGFAGVTLPVELRAIAREFDLGGVILFARNVEAPLQVAEVAYEVKQLSAVPPWVSVDQEGGRVQRLRAPFTEWPPLASLGRCGDSKLAERFARALARELRTVGITMDYAPVLDVLTNAANPVIGDRALSEDPAEVARLGAVLIGALQAEGVAACGKHFPGHGDTSRDSHQELPVVEHDPDRLRAVELLPFRAAIEARAAAIMTAHVRYSALDEAAPATLSRTVIGDLLRDELGYDGLVVTERSGDGGNCRASGGGPGGRRGRQGGMRSGVALRAGPADAGGGHRRLDSCGRGRFVCRSSASRRRWGGSSGPGSAFCRATTGGVRRRRRG